MDSLERKRFNRNVKRRHKRQKGKREQAIFLEQTKARWSERKRKANTTAKSKLGVKNEHS